MSEGTYKTIIGTKGVVFSWVGAAIGPTLITIGLISKEYFFLLIGGVGLLLALLCITDGFRAAKQKSWPGFIAFSLTTSMLLVGGAYFVYMNTDVN